jgi:hypothetical protein
MTDTEQAFAIAGIAAGTSLSVALLAAWFTFLATRRDRRRQLYGEATKAATAWVELLYRVRRRADNKEDARAIIHRVHDAQEALMYHRGWIGSESKMLGRSYDRLVASVKKQTEALTQDAWKSPIRQTPGDALPEEPHPSIDAALAAWLKDVRAHLGTRPIAKMGFWWRNRSTNK